MIALTSLIALAFCAVSILVRVTLKTVFSLGAATSSTTAAGAAAAGAEEGIAMSTMFNRVCVRECALVGFLGGEAGSEDGGTDLERFDEVGGFEESEGGDLVDDGRDLGCESRGRRRGRRGGRSGGGGRGCS